MKKNARLLSALLLVFFALAARPALAADKQHLQMMAEIRLLQEQQQQLQQLIGGLQDTLKTLNAKLDEQSATSRKALADETLAVNNIGDNVRTLREKTDETNVRISSVSQEIDALRQAVASQQAAQPQPGTVVQPGGGSPGPVSPAPGGQPTGNGAPPTTSAEAIPAGVSAQRMYETSFDDYTAGRYDLAIQGFQNFVARFATAPQAADAQFNIGQAYYNQSKWNEARDAYQKVITDFAQRAPASTVADATYKLGQTLEHLNQIDAAKQAYQTILQKYPNTTSASLANSALQRLNRK
jgi:tol-pal system protein YbgF